MIDFSAYDVQTPEILGYRCSKCGSIYYPAPMICAKCSSRRDPVTGKHWETFPLEGPVKLLSWTRVWNLPDGYNVKFLLFGIVEFEQRVARRRTDRRRRPDHRHDAEQPRGGVRRTTGQAGQHIRL